MDTQLNLSRIDDHRDVTVTCEHGTSSLSDVELVGDWTDADLIAQATTYHAVNYRDCRCSFDQDDSAPAEEIDDIDHERPKIFPPLAVQLAALRLMTAARANTLDSNDRGLVIDGRLVFWFRRQERESSD